MLKKIELNYILNTARKDNHHEVYDYNDYVNNNLIKDKSGKSTSYECYYGPIMSQNNICNIIDEELNQLIKLS